VKFTVIVPDVKASDDTDNDGFVEWENIATVVYNNPDDPNGEDPEEDEPEDPVEIEEGIPEVSIQKLQAVNGGNYTDELLEVIAGDKVTYLIQITNNGTEVAEDIVITDVVEDKLVIDEASVKAEGGKLKDRTITWEIDKLEAGKDATVTFTVEVPGVTADEVDADGMYRWQNVATVVYGNNPEGDDPEESDPVEIEEGLPELVINKVADKQKVDAGDVVTYTITVKNEGTGVAEGVKIVDTLPEGLVVNEDSISDDGVYDETKGTITWEFADALAIGEEVTVTYNVTVPEITAEQAGEDGLYEWKNIATVVSDNDPEDPSEDEEIIEQGIPVIDAIKTQAVNDGNPTTEKVEVVAGSHLTYFITVTNAGTGKATNVVITDEIEEGLIFVEGSITNGGILKDGTITWNIPELEGADEEGNPGTVTVSFTVEVPEVDEETVWENVATVDAGNDEEDPEPTNVVEAEEEPTSPVKTGDTANITLCVVTAMLALAVVFVIMRRKMLF